MKKQLLSALSAVLLSTGLMAGGIMTNTNQSAAYARMLARNASLSIDAVYYNPAGLTKLGNGFHISLNNQSIFQTKDVVNSYPYLNSDTYTGTVKAPFFPGIYAAYKMNKLAISFGFNPVGGGGGATYETGLPSFEMAVSDLVPMLQAKAGVTGYKADINFEGTSIYFGYQFGVSYEVCPAFSLFAGVRTVTAKNTYKGYLHNIMINPLIANSPYDGSFMRADVFGTQQATYYTGVASQFTAAASGLDPLVAGGAGSLTPAQAAAMGIITPTQQAQIEGGLSAIGQPTTLTIAQSQQAFQGASAQATAGAAQMTGLAVRTADADVDVVQKGTGYTPIFGANLTIAEKLNIGLKYEMLTKIYLKNETAVDGTGTFPNGAETRADMPAMLSVGASYPVGKKLLVSASYNYYFDKNADYGKRDSIGMPVANDQLIDKNFWELGLGLEYNITDNFLLSAGFLRAQTGVSKNYQTDMSYSLTSNTVAFGGQFKISPAIALNLGGLYTMYDKDDKTFSHRLGTSYIPLTENYSKNTWLLSLGLDVRIGK
jgi:long-chain fatty acid transport protein